MRLRTLGLAAILAASFSLPGCAAKKTITNVPTGVPVTTVQSWDQATTELSKIAQTTTTARQMLIQLNQTTFVNPQGQTEAIFPDGPHYIAALNAIGKVDQLQVQAANLLNSEPNNWSQGTQAVIAGLVQQMGVALGTLTQESTLGIKNPASQAQVQQLITELTSFASLIVQLT